MSLRLASRLVEDGHLARSTVNAALGRQVIYGGTLDTVLLEMRAIDEATLWEALSAATGLQVPPVSTIESPSVEAGALFDSARSERCHAAPVALDAGRLTLLCTEPVQTDALAEAAADLGVELDLFVVPEVRLHAVREALYRRPMSPRFLALLSRLVGAEPVRRWHTGGGEPGAGRRPRRASPSPEPTPEADAPTGPSDARPTTVVATVDASPPPPSDEMLLHRLAGAQTRDEVFDTLAEAVAARMAFVVVMGVNASGRTRVAQGRVVRSGQRRDADRIRRVNVPLDPPSPFRTVVDTALPYVGSPGASEVMRDFLDSIRRGGMPEIVLVPIALRGRVVSVIYADRAGAFALENDTGPLTVCASAAAKALELLILRAKAANFAHTQMEAAGADGFDEHATDVEAPSTEGQRAGPEASPRATASRRSVPEARHDVEALLDAYEADPEGSVGSAAGSAILRRGDVSAVMERLVRGLGGGHAGRAFEQAMLRLIVMFGDAALPLVRPLLEHRDPAWRRRAAEMLVTLTASGSEDTLCKLATDTDNTVRTAALRALRLRAGHPRVAELTERLRAQLLGGTPSASASAAAALGELRDPAAVPLLIDKLRGTSPPVALAAHRALLDITKQDFAFSRWRWSTWWRKWRDRPRMEWLFEGLTHRAPEIRFSASEELKHLTGEYFGYHFDLPRPDREEARSRWLSWWTTQGGAGRTTREGVPSRQTRDATDRGGDR